MMTNQNFVMQGAHNAPITSIEYTKFQNEEVIFSGSEDKTVKAWKVDRTQANLTQIGAITADVGVTTL